MCPLRSWQVQPHTTLRVHITTESETHARVAMDAALGAASCATSVLREEVTMPLNSGLTGFT